MINLKQNEYKKRLIDDKIDVYLTLFGAISIEGPKWCGKTWSSLYHSRSIAYITDKNMQEKAKINPNFIFTEEYPETIDEWQIVPSIWDAVRHKCDETKEKGKFILTGSTSLTKGEEEQVFHSGAGRIATLKMYPMSLYESGDSTGEISLQDLYENKGIDKKVSQVELKDLANLIVRGGWPSNIDTNKEYIDILPKTYIDSIIKKDIHERKDKKRDSNKMLMLLKSLARNESSIASINTIVQDIEENIDEQSLKISRQTISEYLSVLEDLYLINNQEAYSINYRSSQRVGKMAKRHLIDPSISCACLSLTSDKLLDDLNTFGLMLEGLVERDLRIYIEYLDGHLYHFRDNISGMEVDAILEFKNGEYAAVEIKLASTGIDKAKENLIKFYENVQKKPKFMCIILGSYDIAYQDKETGIYIFPITALKP